MFIGSLSFSKIPQIGFFHHFYMENYHMDPSKPPPADPDQQSMEIVYIKSGAVTASAFGQNMLISPGSILVIPHQLQIMLKTADGKPHSHSSVQLIGDFHYELLDKNNINPSQKNLILPFITPPGPENEHLKKDLYSIISSANINMTSPPLAAALSAIGILGKIDSIYRSSLYAAKSITSLWEHKIKHYIAEHINSNIPLSEIAEAFGKSPNYLNGVFKSATGMGIHRYISQEKAKLIGEMILKNDLPFKDACQNVGIMDISYGYRLFKKHMGVTPGTFSAEKKYIK
ncbi:MAG: helix-turn-helix transcriptional regulator [Clostridia bacterium]|nr:helix-turn-helix transcriptional regulator [Clostridia bacterium]